MPHQGVAVLQPACPLNRAKTGRCAVSAWCHESAVLNTLHTWLSTTGPRPSWTGDAKTQSSSAANCVTWLQARKGGQQVSVNDKPFPGRACLYIIGVPFHNPYVQLAPSAPINVGPFQTRAFADTQTKTATQEGHRAKRLPELLDERLELTTVGRLRGCFSRLLAPFTVTSSIGSRCPRGTSRPRREILQDT